MNIVQMVQVFKCLQEGTHSRMALAEQTGATPKAVGKLLTEMKAQGMIFVIDYSRSTDGRNRVKIYSLGNGEDAQPLRSQSQENRSRKSYAKRVRAKRSFTPMTKFAGGISPWQ